MKEPLNLQEKEIKEMVNFSEWNLNLQLQAFSNSSTTAVWHQGKREVDPIGTTAQILQAGQSGYGLVKFGSKRWI